MSPAVRWDDVNFNTPIDHSIFVKDIEERIVLSGLWQLCTGAQDDATVFDDTVSSWQVRGWIGPADSVFRRT